MTESEAALKRSVISASAKTMDPGLANACAFAQTEDYLAKKPFVFVYKRRIPSRISARNTSCIIPCRLIRGLAYVGRPYEIGERRMYRSSPSAALTVRYFAAISMRRRKKISDGFDSGLALTTVTGKTANELR